MVEASIDFSVIRVSVQVRYLVPYVSLRYDRKTVVGRFDIDSLYVLRCVLPLMSFLCSLN